MGRPGWTAEIEVDADLGKVPNDPVEAAKYAVDQVRRLSKPYVNVAHHREDGTVMMWVVDTSDGHVMEIGETTADMTPEQRQDYEAAAERSLCEWTARSHDPTTWHLQFSADDDDHAIACGKHLGELMDERGAIVTMIENNERSTGND